MLLTKNLSLKNTFLSLLGLLFVSMFLTSCHQKLHPDYDELLNYKGIRLYNIQFVDENVGYAAGGVIFKQGMLFQTLDGGKTWQLQAKPPLNNTPENIGVQNFIGMDFLNESKGFVGGWGGQAYRTDNATDWSWAPLMRWSPINGCDFVNDTLLVAVTGEGYAPGFVFHWSLAKGWTLADSLPFALRDVVFTTPTTGYACGYGAIVKTTDSGLHWEYTPAKNDFFTAMSFPSENVGYAVGRTGTILKTTDAGQTWKILRNGNSVFNVRLHFNDVYFLNENLGYIVGDKGLIWKTADGGKTWKTFEKFNKTHLFGIFVFSEGKGFVCGDEGLIARFEE